MEESKNPVPDPYQPGPTHWNVTRDPRKSFLCPLCGASIQLKVLHGSADEEVAALCLSCRTTITIDVWEYYEVLEIIHGI